MTRVRHRRAKARRVVLDDRDKSELRYGDPSDRRLRDLYLTGRDQLIAEARPGTLPLGFWQYEPGVPDELRVSPPRPVAWHVLQHKEPSAEYLEAEAQWRATEDARAAFLERQDRASERADAGYRALAQGGGERLKSRS